MSKQYVIPDTHNGYDFEWRILSDIVKRPDIPQVPYVCSTCMGTGSRLLDEYDTTSYVSGSGMGGRWTPCYCGGRKTKDDPNWVWNPKLPKRLRELVLQAIKQYKVETGTWEEITKTGDE